MPADGRPSLFFSPEAPYPLAGGGALRSASLLEYLARRGPVDLIVFRQPGTDSPAVAIPAGLARRIHVVELPANRRDPASKAWRNTHRLLRGVPPLVDRFSGFGGDVAHFIAGQHYGVAVVEHFWCAPYARELRPHAARLVLDLHNIESRLHAVCSSSGRGPGAWAHRVFARASRRLERRWLSAFDQLLVTSPDDAERAHALSATTPVSVYPNAIPEYPLPKRGGEDVIVFSGNMEYHPNISAVRFFARAVWPRIRERYPKLVWRLVGRNPEAVAKYTRGDERIEVTGAVADAVAELARAKVAVVPLLAGSGTRFKILEAWAAATPVVSTRLGAEGLLARDGCELLLADDAAMIANAVARILDDAALATSLGANGRKLLEERFTWEAAWQQLPF